MEGVERYLSKALAHDLSFFETATLAAFIGAGGLGEPIATGLALADTRLILSGALPAVALPLIVDARLGTRRGTLIVKNAAAFRTTGDGDLSDTQVIVGGTGDFAGASGALRISGTFVAGAGTSSFEGSVCVP